MVETAAVLQWADSVGHFGGLSVPTFDTHTCIFMNIDTNEIHKRHTTLNLQKKNTE